MIIDITGALFTLSFSILNFQIDVKMAPVMSMFLTELSLVPSLKIFYLWKNIERLDCLDLFLKQTIKILENFKPLFNSSDELGI